MLGSLWCWAWLGSMLPVLLLITRLLFLTFTRGLLPIAVCCVAWAAISSLSVCLAWWARCFSRKMGGRHEAVHCNHRYLAFDQSLDVPEKLRLFFIHQ